MGREKPRFTALRRSSSSLARQASSAIHPLPLCHCAYHLPQRRRRLPCADIRRGHPSPSVSPHLPPPACPALSSTSSAISVPPRLAPPPPRLPCSAALIHLPACPAVPSSSSPALIRLPCSHPDRLICSDLCSCRVKWQAIMM
jgi:hypothetical protein